MAPRRYLALVLSCVALFLVRAAYGSPPLPTRSEMLELFEQGVQRCRVVGESIEFVPLKHDEKSESFGLVVVDEVRSLAERCPISARVHVHD